jgi:hypothetical protein
MSIASIKEFERITFAQWQMVVFGAPARSLQAGVRISGGSLGSLSQSPCTANSRYLLFTQNVTLCLFFIETVRGRTTQLVAFECSVE